MEKTKKSFDRFTLYIMVVLIIIGAIMLLSSSSVVAFANFNDPYYYIKKHALYLVMGIVLFIIGFRIPHTIYQKYSLQGLLFSVFLLILTLIPGIGVQLGGAKRWLNLVVFQMQPVEVAKFFAIVFVATSLHNKRQSITSLQKGFIPILAMVCLPVLVLLKQPDLGNTILTMSVTLILMFLGGARLKHLGGLLGGALSAITISVMLHPYQLGRIKTFLFPWRDPLGKSYHIVQSFIAIGSGGIFGQGLGQSKLKYFYLPLQYSDFIFSILCEEGGLILATTVIILNGLLFYRGISIAFYSRNHFSYFLGVGLTLLLVLQAVINMGVAIGLFPVKGVPLTFISFGGTSLIMSMFYVGVLLNISKMSPVLPSNPLEEAQENLKIDG